MSRLSRYIEKRNFDQTPEPRGDGLSWAAPRYSMQKHDATRLHFDLRLEHDGALLSWAVTRGPSLDPGEKRLAVRTEDHPTGYLQFEGVIPPKSYGAGTVMLWDIGAWQPFHDVDDGLRDGRLHFALHGQRLTGNWVLVRMKGRKAADKGRENWLLIKEEDAAANRPDPVAAHARSVATARDLKGIAAEAPPGRFGPARRAANPRFRKPQLATLSSDPEPREARWHEPKLDGYRALVSLGKGGARIFTRSGKDWSDRFAPLLPAFEALPARTALIDGEIVAGAGLDGFSALQKAISAGGPFQFYGFDLLHLDGQDLAPRPLHERRAALERLFAETPPRGLLRLTPVIEGDPAPAWETVCGADGEGLISKRREAPYRGGRSSLWLKHKCEKRAEFVIIGWQPSDKRGRDFASLLLATRDGGALTYRGRVGTGFDAETMEALAAALQSRARKTSPLDHGTPPQGARWVTPELVAEIRYAELTDDGHLRHAAFLGLREDKPARAVKLERPVDEDRLTVAGIGISSPARLVFPDARLTKADVAQYYADAAPLLLAEAKDRPLSLVRLPQGMEGQRFFQKHAAPGFAEALKRVEIEASDGEPATYMALDRPASAVAAAQMGAIEFHIWGARTDRLDRPDRLVFDLDPDEGLPFARLRRAAYELRDLLADLGLPCWALATGGKGLHLVVPLRRVAGWQSVKLFAQGLAALMAARAPERFTASLSKARRKDRIFIDWLRNERGATAIAPFSLRARGGAPVAVPIGWDELARRRKMPRFAMAEALERGWDPVTRPAPSAITEARAGKLAELVAAEG